MDYSGLKTSTQGKERTKLNYLSYFIILYLNDNTLLMYKQLILKCTCKI